MDSAACRPKQCRNGHDGPFRKVSLNGKTYIKCVVCRRASTRRFYLRRHPEAACRPTEIKCLCGARVPVKGRCAPKSCGECRRARILAAARSKAKDRRCAKRAATEAGPLPVCALCASTISRKEKRGMCKRCLSRWHNRRCLARRTGASVERLRVWIDTGTAACWICGRVGRGRDALLEHDHQSGAFRGICCMACNKTMAAIDREIRDRGRDAIAPYLESVHRYATGVQRQQQETA